MEVHTLFAQQCAHVCQAAQARLTTLNVCQAQARPTTLTAENTVMSAQRPLSSLNTNDSWQELFQAATDESKRLRHQLDAKCDEVTEVLKLHAELREAHEKSLGDMQAQRDLLAAAVTQLSSATAEKDRALVALTEAAAEPNGEIRVTKQLRASKQLAAAEDDLSLLGEELQRAKAESEALRALVVEKEASISSLAGAAAGERYALGVQIEAERAAKQDEVDSAKAELAGAWAHFALLAATCLE